MSHLNRTEEKNPAAGSLLRLVFLLSFIIAASCSKTDFRGRNLLLKSDNFDTTINGKKVQLFTMYNKNGIAVQVTNYGGYLVSVITPDKKGQYADVILGYKKISDYLHDKMMAGCIVGPYAHLITKGRFTIDDKQYQLQVRNGGNNTHSKPDGFYKKIFDAVQEGNKVTMTAEAPDMESGFPGNRKVTVIYELLPDDTLRLAMSMTTDRKTICTMTNHAYFNLSGEGTGDVLGHLIQIFADSIIPYSQGYVPTGEIVPVENTPFDLRKPTPIGKMINSENELLRIGKGYDQNFVLSKKKGASGLAVFLSDPQSGRYMKLFTNEPGLQFYSANYLDGSIIGKSGKHYNYRSGVALEPQKYPDSPNHPEFPSPILEPGQTYYHEIRYVFGVK